MKITKNISRACVILSLIMFFIFMSVEWYIGYIKMPKVVNLVESSFYANKENSKFLETYKFLKNLIIKAHTEHIRILIMGFVFGAIFGYGYVYGNNLKKIEEGK